MPFSNLVVENVIMDEHLTEHHHHQGQIRWVEASPLFIPEQKTSHRQMWIFLAAAGVGILVTCAILIPVLGSDNNNNNNNNNNNAKEGSAPSLPPSANNNNNSSSSSNNNDDEMIMDINYSIVVGNTTETFRRDVLPHYSRAALNDPISDQSLALAWLWKETFRRDVLPHYSRAALNDPISDQSLALAWLWKDSDYASSLPNFRRLQRFALATLFYAMENDYDQANLELSSWLSDVPECTWFTNDLPSTVCSNDEFQSLGISEFGLNGTLPPGIGLLLTRLVSIDLSGNPNVLGQLLPSELGLLTRMDRLVAPNCALTGPIPMELGLCTDLFFCDLSFNQLNSTLPTEFGQLNKLVRLNLDYNQFGGALPSEMGKMSELRILVLHDNSLMGSIPAEFAEIPHFQRAILSDNSMSGTLPEELRNLVIMDKIYLHGNIFSGTIPEAFGGMMELGVLTLHDTRLTGSVPSAVCELFELGDLATLSVNCTEVSGACGCCICSVTDPFIYPIL